MSRMVVETITQTLIMTRKAGTHTYSWYGWVSLATEIPTMPNRKIRNIKTITKKHAGSESYQGIITFLYKGFGSSCIIIAYVLKKSRCRSLVSANVADGVANPVRQDGAGCPAGYKLGIGKCCGRGCKPRPAG